MVSEMSVDSTAIVGCLYSAMSERSEYVIAIIHGVRIGGTVAGLSDDVIGRGWG